MITSEVNTASDTFLCVMYTLPGSILLKYRWSQDNGIFSKHTWHYLVKHLSFLY